MSSDHKIGHPTIDRRDLIKRAAAAGSAAWMAPVVLASLPSPAAASSSPAGCFKYMFDWLWAPTLFNCGGDQKGSPQNDATACTQNTGETQSTQKLPNLNCCEDKLPAGPGGDGNVILWNETQDIPGGCIQVSSNQPCLTSTTGLEVTFTILCAGCYISDALIRWDTLERLQDPNYCNIASPSDSSTSSSNLITSLTITFSNTRVPIWFKFWVACGIDPNHPQNDGYFPDTDCSFGTSETVQI